MCAVVIATMGVPQAPPFYRAFPFEPVLPTNRDFLRADRVLPDSPTSVEELIRIMLRALGTGQDLILASHGTSEGLTLPLIGRSTVNLEREALQAIQNNLAGGDQSSGQHVPPGHTQ
jgi:hypothetical protein